MEKLKVYIGGDMLKKGSQMLRDEEKNRINQIELYEAYAPQDDKEINDKSNQTEEANNGLAEKILAKDTRAMLESDIIILDPHENAIGTNVELGQVVGWKQAVEVMQDITDSLIAETTEDDEEISIHSEFAIELMERVREVLDKGVYVQISDVRMTDIPETGARRSYSVNQYTHGAALYATDGVGIQGFEEIEEELKSTSDILKTMEVLVNGN